MWYLIEDFFEQSLVMQALIGWGWLSVLIMATSLADTAWPKIAAVFSGAG